MLLLEFRNQLNKTDFPLASPSNITIIIADGLSGNEITRIKTRGNIGKVYSSVRMITSWRLARVSEVCSSNWKWVDERVFNLRYDSSSIRSRCSIDFEPLMFVTIDVTMAACPSFATNIITVVKIWIADSWGKLNANQDL